MKNQLAILLFLTLGTVFLSLQGAENNEGELGEFSVGNINMMLEVTESVSAGFVYTNLDDPASGFQDLRSYGLIESLQREESATIPFCVISSSGGAFSLDAFEYQGSQNSLESEFGSVIPFDVTIGDSAQPDFRFSAVSDLCNDEEAIPITIRTRNQLNGGEVGRLNGTLNLLIQME